jgi:hypothetical protein
MSLPRSELTPCPDKTHQKAGGSHRRQRQQADRTTGTRLVNGA